MPLDYKRFNGPEDSICYKKLNENFKSYDDILGELIDQNGLRRDGRRLDEARKCFARTDMVSQAKGSAYIEMNKTKVICSVFDPREIMHLNEYCMLGQIFCEVKFAPFSCSRKRHPNAPDVEEKALSVELTKVLEPTVCRHMFPNYQIDVFVYILENDGSCLAAAINAAGLALADAAVPMFDLVTASSVAIIGDQILVDPSEKEEQLAMTSPEEPGKNHGIITMSMLPQLKQVPDYRQIGSIDVKRVTHAMEILESECAKLVAIIRHVVVLKVFNSFKLQKKIEEESLEREERLYEKMDEWATLINSE